MAKSTVYLQVNDATTSPRLTLWYPAAQACAGGSATCSVTLSTGFEAEPTEDPDDLRA